MSLEVTGRLHEVFPTQQIKETFSKREFVLELTDESPTGMVFTNYASFQLVNSATGIIDQFQPGEMLKVNFNIRGNRWEKDGQVRYITNLNAWRVERAMAANQQGMPQQQSFPPTGGSMNTMSGNQPSGGSSAAEDPSGNDLPF